MKKNLLLNKAMVTIVIALFSVLVVSCDKDSDDPIPGPDPNPEVPALVKEVVLGSVVPRISFTEGDSKITLTAALEAKFTLKYDGDKTKDTIVNRQVISSFAVKGNKEVVLIDEGEVIGSPSVNFVSGSSNTEGDVKTFLSNNEFTFLGGFKLEVASESQTQFLKAHNKTVEIAFDNAVSIIDATYKEDEIQVIGQTEVNGKNYIQKKYKLYIKAKMGTEEKVITYNQIFAFYKENEGPVVIDFGINFEETRRVGGVTWGWDKNVKVPVVSVVYGSQGSTDYSGGAGGIQCWANEQKVIAQVWKYLRVYKKDLSVVRTDIGEWVNAFVERHPDPEGWRWVSTYAFMGRDNMKLEKLQNMANPVIGCEFIENEDGSLTIEYEIDGVKKSVTAREFGM